MRIEIRLPERKEIMVKHHSVAARKTPDALVQGEARMATADESEPETYQPVGRGLVNKRVRQKPLLALIRRTFDSARRELERVVEKQRHEVKASAQQENIAVVERILRKQGYGFLRTQEGQQVYFHRNSVLHNHWERLKVGTAVRYASEMGEKGLQASTVEPVDKPGAVEIHDQLHDLPSLSSRK